MTTPRQTATKMAEAAQAWLERLDEAQRPPAQWAGPADDVSEAERRRWFYTPTDHGGLAVHQQRPAQQRAAMTLVAAGLSLAGYVTVATIMGLENVLDRLEGFAARFDRERGRDPRPVLPARLRHPGRRRRLGLPVRRPPRIAEQPRGRRRAGRRHTVLHGRRPGRLATSRRRAQPAAGPGRGPGPRARAVALARAHAAGGAAPE